MSDLAREKGISNKEIAGWRLQNQHLIAGLSSPDVVLRSLCAVQSQDFTGAKWALGQRCLSATDDEVTQSFNDGKILRTHMLRPTWHFVAPEDIVWMQALTAPRVHALNKYYYRQHGLDEATLRKSGEVLAKALQGGKELTRREVKDVYNTAGINAEGLRLVYLIMYAELEAVVCSGALRGKQHTLALIAERAPRAKPLPYQEALVELTRRYFAAHGPATVQDLAWWSSLTVAEIKNGAGLAGMDSFALGGATYYFSRPLEANIPSPVVHLLPNYDEYVISYKDRSLYNSTMLEKSPSPEDLTSHFVMLDGQLAGAWKRSATAKSFTVKLSLLTKPDTAFNNALSASVDRLQNYLRLRVEIEK